MAEKSWIGAEVWALRAPDRQTTGMMASSGVRMVLILLFGALYGIDGLSGGTGAEAKIGMKIVAFLLAILLAACSSNRPQALRRAATTKAANQPKIMAGVGVRNARLLKYVRPAYPTAARKARLQGIVKLRALITKSGEVREIEVLSGDPALAPAALDAVKQWRYAPTEIGGEPVEVRTGIDVQFTLNQ